MQVKTNVMRILEKAHIPYAVYTYPHDKDIAVDGKTVAALVGKDPACVFKTLVTRSAQKSCYVFIIPVEAELDLKKAAKAVGIKALEMLPMKELFALTGYIRGGCSPIGMKKQFPTVLHESALEQDAILVSAGKIGVQVEIAPELLLTQTNGACADIVKLL